MGAVAQRTLACEDAFVWQLSNFYLDTRSFVTNDKYSVTLHCHQMAVEGDES